MTKTLHEPGRDVPVFGTFDVCVLGAYAYWGAAPQPSRRAGAAGGRGGWHPEVRLRFQRSRTGPVLRCPLG